MFCQSENEEVVELKKKNINLEKKLQEKGKGNQTPKACNKQTQSYYI